MESVEAICAEEASSGLLTWPLFLGESPNRKVKFWFADGRLSMNDSILGKIRLL